MADVNLKQLEAFAAVADLRSFRRAAERLNTTQPNISTRVAGLEARLGVVLMERDAGSVRLTPRGEALLPLARRVIRDVETFVGAVGDDGLFEGVIRLGVTEIIVHSWLGDFLKALNARFPHVLVELTVDFSATLSAGLQNRSLDLAFQSGPFERRLSGHAELCDYPLIWVAAPEMAAPRLSIEDLAAHPLLVPARGTTPHADIAARFAKTQARLAPSTNLGAVRQMAKDGLGIACLPEAMVAADLAAGSLQRIECGWTPAPLRFAARFEAERAPAYLASAAEIATEIAAKDKNSEFTR